MKAVTYAAYGPPDVLQLQEVARPEPADSEILIRVRAAEVTKSDCEMRSFRFAVKWFQLPLRIAMGVRRPRRPILGAYFSGEIAAVGSKLRQFTPGEAVFGCAGMRFGAHADYVALPASYAIAPKPSNMSFEDAAAVPLGGLNALHFLRLGGVEHGSAVLINGAGGSIGAYAVQIARAKGASVTAVDKAIKEDFLRSIGADDFVDYQQEDFSRRGKTYDVILDMVPGVAFSSCLRVLNAGGRYLTGNPTVRTMLRCLCTSWFTNKTARFAFAPETREALNELRDMIESGQIGSIVDRIYPMRDAAEAHRRVETEQRLGAVVIRTSSD